MLYLLVAYLATKLELDLGKLTAVFVAIWIGHVLLVDLSTETGLTQNLGRIWWETRYFHHGLFGS